MRSRTAKLAVAHLVVLALLTGACERDKGDKGAQSGSKPQFVARAGAVCERVARTTAARANDLFTLRPTPEEATRFVGEIVPALEQGFSDLRRLDPPAADRAPVAAMLGAGDEEVVRLKSIATRAGSGDAGAIDDLYKSPPFAAFKQQAGAYGIERCAAERNAQGGEAGGARQGALAPEKKVYIDKGDATCEQFGGDKAVIDPFFESRFKNGPPTLELWGVSLGATFLFFYRQEVQALRAVEPPPADKALITAALDRYDELYTRAQPVADAARSGDREGFRKDFAEVAAMAASADKAFVDYGFSKCKPSHFLLAGVAVERVPRLP